MLHVNRPLTDISTSYIQSASNFIATQVFPTVNVQKQSDLYEKYDKADMLRIEVKERAPGTQSAGAGFKLSTDPYYCKKYALHKDIAEDDRVNQDSPINLDGDTTEFLTQQLLMERERKFFATFFKTGIWYADVTPSTLWDATGSSPFEDITAQIEVITSQTGQSPSDMTLTLAPDVWAVLKNHPEFIDRVKGMGSNMNPARGMLNAFSTVLEIKNVLIGRAIYNSSAEGDTTPTYGYIAKPKAALLTYAPPSGSLKKPSAAYIFNWAGLIGSGAGANRVKKFWMDEIESDRIEAEMAYDMKQISKDAGIYFNAVIS
jgi:hypothetical protein